MRKPASCSAKGADPDGGQNTRHARRIWFRTVRDCRPGQVAVPNLNRNLLMEEANLKPNHLHGLEEANLKPNHLHGSQDGGVTARSHDATLEVLRRNFGDRPNVRILSQPNAGKSAALNNAIARARHDLLIALDADTIFRAGTIGKLVRHFADSQVGAVSGNARVGNRNSWITRFQSIEYIYGFNLDRRALDLLNAITVVPGAVGAWRKELILKLGGFGDDTLAEDTDLTLKIRRAGYQIRYEEDGVAFTEAPEDTRGLAKQRFRWAFGTLQAAWKHRDALFVPKYGTLGFVALPSIWIFQVLLSALSPFAELAMIVALFAGNWRIVLIFYLGFFVLEFLTGLMAYWLEGEKPWDLALLFFQRIYYRELMYYVVAKSLIYAVRGRVVGWGKLERRATVAGV